MAACVCNLGWDVDKGADYDSIFPLASLPWYFHWHPWFIIYTWKRFTDLTDNPSPQKINTLISHQCEIRCTWKGQGIHLQALLAPCPFPWIQADDRESWGFRRTSQSPWGWNQPNLPYWKEDLEAGPVWFIRAQGEANKLSQCCGVQICEGTALRTSHLSRCACRKLIGKPWQVTRLSLSRWVCTSFPCHMRIPAAS